MDRVTIRSNWVGRVVDGRLPLQAWVGSAETGEVFRTEVHGMRAAILIIPVTATDAQAQLEDWGMAASLANSCLLHIAEGGRSSFDGDEFIFAVTEFPDESLSQVLPDRPLSTDEARGMLDPLLTALGFLHEKGLVHGSLQPAHILVVGDRVKLSSFAIERSGRGPTAATAALYTAPELAAGELDPSADVWSLGMTLVESLTQELPQWDRNGSADPVVPASVPSPFREIATRCLRRQPAERCGLDEIRELLNPGVTVESVPVMAVMEIAEVMPIPMVPETIVVPAEPVALAEPVAPVEPAAAVGPAPTQPAPVAIGTLEPVPQPAVAVPVPNPAPEVLPPTSAPAPAVPVEAPRQAETPKEAVQAPVPPPAPRPEATPARQAAFAFESAEPSRRSRSLFDTEGDDEDEEPRSSKRGWIFAAIAAVLLVAAAFFWRSHNHRAAEQAASATPPAQSEAANSAAPTSQSQESAPAPAQTQSAPQTPASSSPNPPAQQNAPAAPPVAPPTQAAPKPAPQTEEPAAAPEEKPSRHGNGAVLTRVMPEVPSRLQHGIHGKLDVHVRVEVDRNGAVRRAHIVDARRGDRYFANLAEIAARKWRFKPAHVVGKAVPSEWVLRFDFRRNRTDAAATEVKP